MIYAQEQLLPWARHVLDGRGVDLFDAHVHVGLDDPGGILATADQALDALEQVGSGAFVFPLMDPAGYRAANRRVLDLARSRPRTVRALCRLDPGDEPLAEAQQCLDAGAAGIKLHPRGDGFALADPRLDDVFALADERRLPVMVHAGPGNPEIGGHAIARAGEHPGARIILAHCAVGAFETVVPRAGELRNLFFDTAWWNPADVWALLHAVAPGQILFASDIPFASPAECIVLTARLAVQAGLSDAAIRSIMGGQAARLADGDDPVDCGPPPAVTEPLAPELERLYVTLCTSVEPMLRREDPGEGIELALAACEAPPAGHEDLVASIGELLRLSREQQPDPLRSGRTPGFDLVLAAAVLARTPRAGAPPG